MSNLLPFDHLSSDESQQTATHKKSLAYFLGRGLGKAVVSTRHKLSGISEAIHHSIEDDVEKRLAEQEKFHDMLHHQQELAHGEYIEQLRRRHLRVTFAMTVIGLTMGIISAVLLFWYYAHH